MPPTLITIDKVYIDGPCEGLIRRSIDKLLAEHFLESGNSREKSYCRHLSWEIPEPNNTAYALFILVLFIKVSHVTHSFETRKPHGPSMYTLSMLIIQAVPEYTDAVAKDPDPCGSKKF